MIDQYLTLQSKDTVCEVPGYNADINGDGRVDALDLSFISLNFLESDKGSCCPALTASARPAGRTSVPMEELRSRGLRQVLRMDHYGNGRFDPADVAAFLRGEFTGKNHDAANHDQR